MVEASQKHNIVKNLETKYIQQWNIVNLLKLIHFLYYNDDPVGLQLYKAGESGQKLHLNPGF
jgi:hypothetical protein